MKDEENERPVISFTRQEMALTMNMHERTQYEIISKPSRFWTWDRRLNPGWNWNEYLYRPVAPKGWKHTGRFEVPKRGDYYLSWKFGYEIEATTDHQNHRNIRCWILESDDERCEHGFLNVRTVCPRCNPTQKGLEDSEQVEYEIYLDDNYKRYALRYQCFFVSQLPGLVIDGRVFDIYKLANGHECSTFRPCEPTGELPTHAVFRRVE